MFLLFAVLQRVLDLSSSVESHESSPYLLPQQLHKAFARVLLPSIFNLSQILLLSIVLLGLCTRALARPRTQGLVHTRNKPLPQSQSVLNQNIKKHPISLKSQMPLKMRDHSSLGLLPMGLLPWASAPVYARWYSSPPSSPPSRPAVGHVISKGGLVGSPHATLRVCC